MSFTKKIDVSFSKVSSLNEDEDKDQVISVPSSYKVFDLASGGKILLPENRCDKYSEDQIKGIICDIDVMILGDDNK